MDTYNLKNYTNGWFIGNFIPTIIDNNNFEIAIKRYNANDKESAHYHKVATEITVIVSGKVMMNNTIYNENDIIVIYPNEKTDFVCLTDVVTCVIKMPSVMGDKYND